MSRGTVVKEREESDVSRRVVKITTAVRVGDLYLYSTGTAAREKVQPIKLKNMRKRGTGCFVVRKERVTCVDPGPWTPASWRNLLKHVVSTAFAQSHRQTFPNSVNKNGTLVERKSE